MKRYLLGVFLALLLVSIPLGANSEGQSVSAQITDTEGNTFNVKEVEFGLSRDDTSAQWGKAVVRIKVKDIKKLDRIERPPKNKHTYFNIQLRDGTTAEILIHHNQSIKGKSSLGSFEIRIPALKEVIFH